MEWIATIGRNTLDFLGAWGRAFLFLVTAIIAKPSKHFFPRFITQLYAVGVLSLPIILFAALFVGMVLGLQGYTVLVRFGAEEALGQMIALSLVRELGPVVGALLFAGRAGSALTAEISLLKTTEQLDTLRLMGIEPLHRVIAPRFFAGIVCLPLLTLIFNAVAILGGYMLCVEWLGVDGGGFWANMQANVNFREDIINGVIKSMVFGGVVTWIAVYQGYESVPTGEGIALATTRGVVYSSLAILALDFILTAVMFTAFK